MIEYFRKEAEHLSITELMEEILTETGYVEELKAEGEEEAEARLQNIDEFLNKIAAYEESCEEELPTLSGFLEEVLKSRHWDALVDFLVYTSDEFRGRVDKLLESTNQYLFLSSSRVYANQYEKLVEESPRLLDVCKDQAFLDSDDYPITKARQENILFDANKQNWTIIRPYITFSEQRLQLGVYEKEYWLYRALEDKTIVFSKELLKRKTTLTYGYDVALGIAKLIGNKKAYREAFHITGTEVFTWERILEIYANTIKKVTGNEPGIYFSQDLSTVYYSIGSVWPIDYDRAYDREFDNSKFLDAVGHHFKFQNAEKKLQECLCEFLSKKDGFKEIPWGAHAYFDRITKEHTPLYNIPGRKNKLLYLTYRYTNLYKRRVRNAMRSKGQEIV